MHVYAIYKDWKCAENAISCSAHVYMIYTGSKCTIADNSRGNKRGNIVTQKNVQKSLTLCFKICYICRQINIPHNPRVEQERKAHFHWNIAHGWSDWLLMLFSSVHCYLFKAIICFLLSLRVLLYKMLYRILVLCLCNYGIIYCIYFFCWYQKLERL